MPLRKDEDKSKKLLFTVVIGFVLLFSIIGFTFSAIPFGSVTQNNLKYGDIELVQTQLGLATLVNGQILEFTYYPEDVAATDVSLVTGKLTSARVVYATSDPNSSMAAQISGAQFDIGRVLDSRHNNFLDVAFTVENPYNRPVITCGDATPLIPVLLFNFTNSTTQITEISNCVIINFASENSLTRIRDKILYELLGVRPRA